MDICSELSDAQVTLTFACIHELKSCIYFVATTVWHRSLYGHDELAWDLMDHVLKFLAPWVGSNCIAGFIGAVAGMR